MAGASQIAVHCWLKCDPRFTGEATELSRDVAD